MRTVVDVGGSSGSMLTAILTRYANTRGLLFDLPHALRDTPAVLQVRGLAERVDVRYGKDSIKS